MSRKLSDAALIFCTQDVLTTARKRWTWNALKTYFGNLVTSDTSYVIFSWMSTHWLQKENPIRSRSATLTSHTFHWRSQSWRNRFVRCVRCGRLGHRWKDQREVSPGPRSETLAGFGTDEKTMRVERHGPLMNSQQWLKSTATCITWSMLEKQY